MQNIYSYTVPLFTKLLKGLKTVLGKAEKHAKDLNLSEESILSDALAPDMFPLKKQVQIACDNAKGLVSRLTQNENPVHPDSEVTFAELQSRIDTVLEMLELVTAKDFDGAEKLKITLPYFPGKYMMGDEYAIDYALPNFVFHVTTAYAIVRKNGVQIGKSDFMHSLPFKDI